MSDKSKYTIFEIIIPGYVYIKPNVNVLCETVHEIWKSKFFFDGSHFEYCKKLWKHQNLRLLPSKFQISCFCPDVKIYYIKSPH